MGLLRQYSLRLSATANVRALVTVVAESEQDARRIARMDAANWDVVWEYDGIHDGTIEVEA